MDMVDYGSLDLNRRKPHIKHNSQTQTHDVGPPTLLDLQVATVVQQPRTHQSEGKVTVEWRWGSYMYPRGGRRLDMTPPHPNHGCHMSLGEHAIHISTAFV